MREVAANDFSLPKMDEDVKKTRSNEARTSRFISPEMEPVSISVFPSAVMVKDPVVVTMANASNQSVRLVD